MYKITYIYKKLVIMLRRLNEFIKFRNISFNKFEISIGVSHGSISNAFKHNKNIGSNVVQKVLEVYPELSAEWLLRGTGAMILSSDAVAKVQNQDGNSAEWNELLVSQAQQFFGVESKSELQLFLSINASNKNNDSPFAELILQTWERKYGQELKSLSRQVMTLFTAKLDQEANPIYQIEVKSEVV